MEHASARDTANNGGKAAQRHKARVTGGISGRRGGGIPARSRPPAARVRIKIQTAQVAVDAEPGQEKKFTVKCRR